jgi:hypothetical protein
VVQLEDPVVDVGLVELEVVDDVAQDVRHGGARLTAGGVCTGFLHFKTFFSACVCGGNVSEMQFRLFVLLFFQEGLLDFNLN